MLLDGFAFEVGEALRDGAHLLLDFGAERGGGGGVVVAEVLEIVLEGLAEGCDVADDFVAQVVAELELSSRVRRASSAMRRLSLSGSSVRRGSCAAGADLRSRR